MSSGRILLLAASSALVFSAAAGATTLTYVKDGEVMIANADNSGAHAVTSAPNNWAWPSTDDNGVVVAAGGQARFPAPGTDTEGSDLVYRLSQYGAQLSTPGTTIGTYSTPSCPTYPPSHLRVAPDGTEVSYDVFNCDHFVIYRQNAPGDMGGGQTYASDYQDPVYIDNGHVLISHLGTTISSTQAVYALWDLGAGTGSGPSGDTYLPDRQFAAPRNASRVAVFERDFDTMGNTTAADIQIFATAGGDLTADPVFKCKLTLDAAKVGTSESANPVFTPDGTSLAWGDSDGIHVANTSNLDNCSSLAPTLLVPGGKQPFFGAGPLTPAPASGTTTGTGSGTGTSGGTGGTQSTGTGGNTGSTGTDDGTTSSSFAVRSPSKRAKLTPARTISFTLVSADTGIARITARVYVPGRGKPLTFAARTVRLTAAHATKIKLRLSRRSAAVARAALRHHRKLTARVHVVVTADGGQTVRRSLAIRLT